MKVYKNIEKDFSVKSNKKITHYKEKLPLFESYGIKNPIHSLMEENILKSGGYLVINPTEALTSIDINSDVRHQKKILNYSLKYKFRSVMKYLNNSTKKYRRINCNRLY